MSYRAGFDPTDNSPGALAYRNSNWYDNKEKLTIALAGNEERAEDLCRLISNWKELENAKVSGIRSDKLNIAIVRTS
jgi:hypothetical protein